MWSLFVGDLSAHIRHQDLENTFRRFGQSKIVLKNGFAFAMYEEHRDAERALLALQGKPICGERVSLSWAKVRRPLKRPLDKGNYERKHLWDKYGEQPTIRRSFDRISEGERRGSNLLDRGKDDLRTSNDGSQIIGKEGEAKDPQSAFNNEANDLDPLDAGRWDPHAEGSLDHILGDENRDNDNHTLDTREDDRGSAHERSKGYTENKHLSEASRAHRYPHGRFKRGRDFAPDKAPERLHFDYANAKRQRMNSMHRRDGFDGGRNEMRYFRGVGSFRGAGNGRFRGMDGSRRISNRGVEGSYGRNNMRRHMSRDDRWHHDQVELGHWERNRRAYNRSKIPKDRSQGRSKVKLKSSNKKDLQSPRKRRKLSSSSKSHSGSSKASSSSSESESSSKSHSSSQSGSSTSESHASSSTSQSHQSPSNSSSSQSQSSSSPSRTSSQSKKTDKGSKSPMSESRVVSHSSYSHPSQTISSSKSRKVDHSPSRTPENGSDHKYDDEKAGTSSKHESCMLELEDKQVYESHDTKCSSKDGNEYGQGTESNDSQKNNSKSTRSSIPLNENSSGNDQVYKSAKESMMAPDHHPPTHENEAPDTVKCRMYMAIMNEIHKHDTSSGWGIEDHGAARLWPWESILYRRLKRGPISTENYERRKAQNKEFGIEDRFIRSSSGWWEKPLE